MASTPTTKPAVGCPTHELRLHKALLARPERFVPRPAGLLRPFHELELRHGRPDVVVVDLDWEQFELRSAAGIRPLPSIAATATVAYLRAAGGRSPIAELQNSVAELVGERAARRALQELRKLGWVAGSSRLVLIDVQRSPLIHRAVGIEAKLGRWRAASRQAYRFRGLVNEAWLAFPSSYLGRLPVDVPGLRLLGIAGVEPDGEVGAMTAPPARVVDRCQSVLFEQYLYRRLLEEEATPAVETPPLRASLAAA